MKQGRKEGREGGRKKEGSKRDKGEEEGEKKRLIRGNELWKGKKGVAIQTVVTNREREKCGREIGREMVESDDKERSASKGRPYKIQRNEE